ncbi:S8 family serine peptidase [Marimonas arenosa]|uniref:S8 family serine peptidase n=1 Tax=Marimonas arenosa TaxID=1795305 RepID=A0AAE4B6X4_9RHOB|nr:S8 family serine peptidase [Marimonas arenosa]MDQ2091804.1 S8 family serine peptidase [Marimonas arenosa]
MTYDPSPARRIHPLLRVIRNGDQTVNSCRAKISGRVFSAAEPKPEKKGLELLNLAGAQQAVALHDPSSEIDLVSLTSRQLTKRPKWPEVEPASTSFVNVSIEVTPRPDDKGSDGSDVAAERIAAACRNALPKAKSKRPPGMVNRRGRLISATVPVSFLDTLWTDPDVTFVQPAETLSIDLPLEEGDTGRTERKIGGEDVHGRGAGILVGIIDVGGFDFAHPDFLRADGTTRFNRIWDQGGSFRTTAAHLGYGCEFTQAQMNDAIRAEAAGGLPATEIERQSQRSPGSHATHVASIAAGNEGVCPEAEIIAVLVDVPLPEEDRERRAFTFSDSSRIIDAIEYLIATANEIGKPITINVSLGTNGGAHDGSSGVTRWIDSALTVPGRSVCFAAGNAGQQDSTGPEDFGFIMGRIHTSGRIPARGLDTEIEWVVVGNGIADISENELEIWYSPQDRFEVEVLPPGDTTWLRAAPQEYFENERLSDGTTVSIYNELYHPANGANYISIYLSPNLTPGQFRGIRAGVWRVRLRGVDIRNGRFHCWIERDDPRNLGAFGGMQFWRFPSFFTEASNVDSHSISSLACGNNAVAVSNYDAASNRMNITSSQGPTRDGRFKPDIAAPGSKILAANGFDSRDALWTAKSGTSMASPYVAGVIGLMLNANPGLNAAQCLGILQRTSRPLPGGTYDWVNDAGFGRIDPETAIQEAASFSNRRDLNA